MAQAREHARHELIPRRRVVLVTWGLVWLIGYGVIWLSVRGQRPYQGPGTAALGPLFILLILAAAITAIVMSRATSGIGGRSALQRRLYYLSFPIGYIGVLTLEAALDHGGASRAVISLFGAAAPILMTGMIYLGSAAVSLDWVVFGLGLWLVVVAAGSGFAGPWTVWGVDGLAGGLAFLLLAAVGPWRDGL
jgi:hypothetical protein